MQIKNAANGENEMLIYGDIDDYSIDLQQLHTQIKQMGDFTIRLNSYGGDVFIAQTIYNLLAEHTGYITCKIDGIAASAATIIASACDKIIMPSNAIYMIHNPAVLIFDYMDENKLQSLQSSLQATKSTIVSVYESRCQNIDAPTISQMMSDETWLDAEQAKEYGFIDEISEDVEVVENSGTRTYNGILVNLSKMHKWAGTKKEKDMENDKQGLNNEESLADKIVNAIKNGFNKQKQENENDAQEDAVTKERKRIKDLMGYECKNEAEREIVNAAIDNGGTLGTIQPYLNAVRKGLEEKQGHEQIRDIIIDNATSGGEKIMPNPTTETDPKNDTEKMINALTEALTKLGKGKQK